MTTLSQSIAWDSAPKPAKQAATVPVRVVRNPWHRRDSAYSSPTYTLTGRPVFSHRGVDVYRYPAGGFLHVLDGVAISHRVGVDMTGGVIDAILDGGCCSFDAVAAHLREHGFKAMTYAEYSAEVAAGRLE